MTLQERINEVKAILGYIHHELKSQEHGDKVQNYTFWFDRDGRIRTYVVSFLVVDQGEPSEAAYCYDTSHIISPATPFKDKVEAGIAAFQTSHPGYEKLYVKNCSEDMEMAFVSGYNVTGDDAKAVEAVVYKKDGSLAFKLLPATTV